MRTLVRCSLLVWLFGSGATAALAAPRVVVAVDTSRSLSPETVASMGEAAAAALGRLPAATEVGVLAFDDAPRWVMKSGSPAEAVAALGELVPAGRFTLLDDALFTAARELAPGGVVLLLTDGRDENSATTLEDVARAGDARGMRIVAVGAGDRLDERALRRLALLTGGSYVGRLGTVTPASLGDTLATVAAMPPPATFAASPAAPTAARPARDEAPAPAPAPANVPAASRAGEAPAPVAARLGEPRTAGPLTVVPSAARRWWWLLPLAVAVVGAPAVAWTLRRGRKRTSICRRCGGEVPAGEDCPKCAAQEAELALQERLRGRDLTRIDQTSELRLDALQELSTGAVDLDRIEKTRVIADQAMLLIREPGESQRSFLLRSDGAFAVGRDPRTNTLTLRDPALSARHLKVVPDDGWFYIVDLESTNGTYLNRRRVRAARLASGDLIQAGQVELEFRSFLGQVA